MKNLTLDVPAAHICGSRNPKTELESINAQLAKLSRAVAKMATSNSQTAEAGTTPPALTVITGGSS